MPAEPANPALNPPRSPSVPASCKAFEPLLNGRSLALKGLGLLAVLCLIARARLQSITIDEAESFLTYVARPDPWQWDAAANNHVLNSLLVRLTTLVFGVSPFTVRLPALLGAVIYIVSAYYLSKLFARRLSFQTIVFVCLVYNPFILDYLVAARGYSLALGFLLCAVAAGACAHVLGASTAAYLRTCVFCSICLALSFAASFSFAIVCALTLLAVGAAAFRPVRRPADGGNTRILPLLAACILPGLGVSLLLSIPTVARWPRGQLVFGANSLGQTIESVVQPSLWRPNPHVLNPWALAGMESLRPFLLPVLGLLCLCAAVLSFRDRRLWPVERSPMWRLTLALHAVTALSLAAHWALHVCFGVLLPRDRTASFLVPLATLCACSWTALPSARRAAAAARASTAAVLALLGLYYLGCLRLTCFREWYWNSDSRTVYSILSHYSHTHRISDIAVSWKCVASLNFYRYMYKDESMKEFHSDPGKYPSGKSVYVLDYPLDSGVVQREGLKIVYSGPLSEIVVAVKPELESSGQS